MTEAQPAVWSGKAVINAVWVATKEPDDWIVARLDALFDAVTESLGVGRWQASSGARWAGSPADKAAVVRSFAATDPFVDPEPGAGVTFTVSGAGDRVGLHVRVSAGSDTLGRRIPLHTLGIELRNMVPGGVDTTVGDTLVAAVAEHWRPAVVTLADLDLIRAARRGGWKVDFGYRVWLAPEVGSIGPVATGADIAQLAGGTLIAVPDDWPAQQVVDVVGATLAMNGIDEIPR